MCIIHARARSSPATIGRLHRLGNYKTGCKWTGEYKPLLPVQYQSQMRLTSLAGADSHIQVSTKLGSMAAALTHVTAPRATITAGTANAQPIHVLYYSKPSAISGAPMSLCSERPTYGDRGAGFGCLTLLLPAPVALFWLSTADHCSHFLLVPKAASLTSPFSLPFSLIMFYRAPRHRPPNPRNTLDPSASITVMYFFMLHYSAAKPSITTKRV